MNNLKRKDSKGRILQKGESVRSDGRYVYRYTDIDGKRKAVYHQTLNGLRLLEKQIQKDINDGIGYKDSEITFNDYFQKYMKLKSNLAASTQRSYMNSWKLYIQNSRFGSMKLKDITKSDVILLLRYIEEKGLKKSSIDVIIAGILSPCFNLAVDDNIIRNNPCKGCRKALSGEDSKPREALTIDQQHRFLIYAQNSKYAMWYPMFVFMIETAVRIGELCGLTWNDVDFKNGFVHIDHQLQFNKGDDGVYDCHIYPPKSKSGVRNVPLSQRAKEALLEQKEIQFESNRRTTKEVDGYKDFVFSNRTGGILSSKNIGSLMTRLVNDYNFDAQKMGLDVGLPHITPHTLRHTGCSRMAEAGIDPRTLQSILGHSTIKMTMEIYNHVTDDRLTNEIKKMNLQVV